MPLTVECVKQGFRRAFIPRLAATVTFVPTLPCAASAQASGSSHSAG